MGIRKIPPGTRVPTGYFYSLKNGKLMDCESPLEMDCCLMAEFDDDIEKYDTQPIKVPNPNTPNNPYVPDMIFFYKQKTGRKPLLVEVKSEKDILDPKKGPLLKLKLGAIEKYAADNGMDIKVVRDVDIRGNYLDNLRFLYGYREQPKLLSSHKDRILDQLKGRSLNVTELLDLIARDRFDRGWLLRSVWYLVWAKMIFTDLTAPLTNSSVLQVKL